MIEIYITIYTLISLIILFLGTKVQHMSGDQFPNWMIILVAVLWIVFLPPAMYRVMKDEE